jgi:hypothetical protein
MVWTDATYKVLGKMFALYSDAIIISLWGQGHESEFHPRILGLPAEFSTWIEIGDMPV